jgi:hypothetical protein
MLTGRGEAGIAIGCGVEVPPTIQPKRPAGPFLGVRVGTEPRKRWGKAG